jgi:hypothetical protein
MRFCMCLGLNHSDPFVLHAHMVVAPARVQDAGFFDTTKTGEVTSRLSADTTTVSDQICLNLNVMLRSATQVGWGKFSSRWGVKGR